jgi:hypothetical protein
VDWAAVVLLFLAGFPVWMPVLARYVKAIKKPEQGYEVESSTRQATLSVEKLKQLEVRTVLKFGDLPLQARRILKSLWHIQRERFGERNERRWGFGVTNKAPFSGAFWHGVYVLSQSGFVVTDPNGMTYLSDEGLEFCRENRDELDAEPLYYKSFGPAPSATPLTVR